jgi:hypothetical protein
MAQQWASGAAVLLADGRVLAPVGDPGRTATELYDPATGMWTAGPQLPAPVTSSTPVVLANGAVLLLGSATCSSDGLWGKCIPTTARDGSGQVATTTVSGALHIAGAAAGRHA